MAGGNPSAVPLTPPPRNPGRLTCVRIMLVIMSVLILSAAIWTLIVGSTMLSFAATQSTGSKDNNSENSSASFDIAVKSIAVVSIIYGSFLLFTGLMGFLGAATRVRLFLTLYFIGVTFTILFTIGGGTYSVLAVKSKQASWAEIDVQRWTASSDADKALAQYVYSCCGFKRGDSLAYTGPPLYDVNEGINPCSPSSFSTKLNATSYPGCSGAGKKFWAERVASSTASMISAIVFLIVACILAAFTNRYFKEADGGSVLSGGRGRTGKRKPVPGHGGDYGALNNAGDDAMYQTRDDESA